ncbi:hypothetical protein APHAL10511_005491 [Amanita phalloides]|nr:hypothetical protein APHAL10511_005491 [Amanita phalloides]
MLATRAKRMKILGDLRKDLDIKEDYGREAQYLNESRATYSETISRSSTLNPDVEPLTRRQENLLRRYLHYVETTQRLRVHLKEVNEDLENFEYMVKSQAVAELTTYRGFNDWGETMYSYMSNYATGLGGLSIAGAGLVYSTIFK